MRFRFDPGELPSDAWMNLGEAAAKLQWIGSSSMRPVVEEQLLLNLECSGIHATAALAGNTLDEQDVRQLVVDGLGPPPGEEYLWREVINLHDAHRVTVGLIGQDNFELTPESIRIQNSMVLHGPDHDDGTVRGEIRSGSVTAGNHRGPSPEDCEYLLHRLCDWLNGPDFAVGDDDPDFHLKLIAKALVAHLYLASIHPFAAGNGRTARLLEFRLLAEAGIPLVTCYVPANHYNRTITEYHQVIERFGRVEPSGVGDFFSYALRGLAEELDEVLDWIVTDHQLIVWENIIFEQFADQNSPAARRRGMLARSLPPLRTTRQADIPNLTARLARAYARKNPKTLAGDLDFLIDRGLLLRVDDGYEPNLGILEDFRPRGA